MNETNIGQLRQWLNEDRITDPAKMVTNEELMVWLAPQPPKSLEGKERKLRDVIEEAFDSYGENYEVYNTKAFFKDIETYVSSLLTSQREAGYELRDQEYAATLPGVIAEARAEVVDELVVKVVGMKYALNTKTFPFEKFEKTHDESDGWHAALKAILDLLTENRSV